MKNQKLTLTTVQHATMTALDKLGTAEARVLRESLKPLNLDYKAVSNCLTRLVHNKWAISEKKDGPYKTYSLTKLGTGILHDKDVRTVDRYPSKIKAKEKKLIEREPPPLDISQTADNLANTVSQVIQENAAYRELLLKVAQTVCQTLGYQIVKKQKNIPPQD